MDKERDGGFWFIRKGTGKMKNIEQAVEIIDSIKADKEIYREEDGLVYESKTYLNDIDHIVPSSNCYWGLLLNAVGLKEDALKVVDSIKNSKFYRNDALVRCFHYAGDGSNKIIKKSYSYDNALWGLLLSRTGLKQEAERLADAIHKDYHCYLLNKYADESRWSNILSYPSAFFGMLLKSLERKDQAKQIKDELKKGVNHSVVKKITEMTKVWLEGNYEIYNEHNPVWGLYLSAIEDEDAENVVKNIKGWSVKYDNLIGNRLHEGYGSMEITTETYINCYFALLLQSLGHDEDAEKIINSLKKKPYSTNENGLVQQRVYDKDAWTNINSDDNALWGLVLLRNGYEVFTG